MDEATTPEISHAELLTARKVDIKESAYAGSKELQRTMQRGKELQELDKDKTGTGKAGLDALRPAREIPQFTRSSFNSMAREFGAGFAVVDPKDGDRIVIDETRLESDIDDPLLQKEAKRHLTEANKSLATFRRFNTYTEILQEAERTGKAIEQVAKDKGEKNWEKFRGTVLDTLLESNTIRTICPELDKLTPDLRREFIDKYMAQDPKFRDAILKNLDGVRQGMDFAQIEQNAEYKQAVASERAAEKTIQDSSRKIEGILNTNGKELTEEEKVNLKAALEGKGSIDSVLLGIRGDRTTPEMRTLIQYNTRRTELETLQKELKNMDPKRTSEEARTLQVNQIKAAQEQLDTLQSDYDKIDNKELIFQEYTSLVHLTQKSIGNSSTAIGAEVSQVAEALIQQRNAQETVTRLQDEVKKNMRGDARDRLAQEAGKLSDLKGVLDNAIIDVLSDRYDELIELVRERIAKEQDEMMKADLQKLQEVRDVKMGRNVEQKNGRITRTETINYDQLSLDIRLAAFKGEEGIKRMLLRDLYGDKFLFEYSYKDGDTQKVDTTHWDTVNLEHLSDDQKQRLEAVYSQDGTNYQKNIATDFWKARLEAGFRDRRKLNINDTEWILFNNNFPGVAEAGKAESEITDDTLNNLVEKGVIDHSTRDWLKENKGKLAAGGIGIGLLLMLVLGIGLPALSALPHTISGVGAGLSQLRNAQ